MSTDAIVVLRAEHKQIKRLFRSFERSAASGEREELVRAILELLALHTRIENEVLYARVREQVPDLESDILESYEEHHVADVLCAELAELTPADERFVAKTTVLIESVEHHIEEEEHAWFPTVRERLGRKALQEIGAQMLELRERAAKERAGSVRRAKRRLPAQVGAATRPRPALTPPPDAVDAVAAGDPGLGGAMRELVETAGVTSAVGARTQPASAVTSPARR